jgi:hypothetical protein
MLMTEMTAIASQRLEQLTMSASSPHATYLYLKQISFLPPQRVVCQTAFSQDHDVLGKNAEDSAERSP